MLRYLSTIAVDGVIVLSCYAQFNNCFFVNFFPRVCSWAELRSQPMREWSQECLIGGMMLGRSVSSSSFPDAPNNRKGGVIRENGFTSPAVQSPLPWAEYHSATDVFPGEKHFFSCFYWTKHLNIHVQGGKVCGSLDLITAWPSFGSNNSTKHFA